MLEDFDIKAFSDPEFQEDSVREEIIGPILKYLGYGPSGSPKVVRIRKLPVETRKYISKSLSRQPYQVHGIDPICVCFCGHFGALTHAVYEEFVPIIVTEIKPTNFDF